MRTHKMYVNLSHAWFLNYGLYPSGAAPDRYLRAGGGDRRGGENPARRHYLPYRQRARAARLTYHLRYLRSVSR